MGIEQDVSSNKTSLLIMPSAEYNHILVDVLKELSGKTVCYVTLNKTFDSLAEILKKNNVNMDDIVFIDAISKTIKKTPNQEGNTYFVSSPGALTELSLVIGKFLKHDFDYLIFDSVNNLKIYQKIPTCAKFISSLVNKVKLTGTKAIFYGMGTAEQEEIIRDTSTFVDKVIKRKEKSI